MSIDPTLIQSWAVEAGQMAAKYFKQGCKWQLKKDNTFVTEADREVESFLTGKIVQNFPGHVIIAEEGSRVKGKEFAWVIDPIDGTTAFVWGVPTWCISIGVLRNWEPYFGLIYLPLTQETYMTNEQGDVSWNGRPIKSNSIIDSSSLLCISPRTLQRYSVSFPGYTTSFGSGILHNCMSARGIAVGAITLEPNIWDLAGVYPIIKGAGGSIQYLSGETFQINHLIDIKSGKPRVSQNPLIVSHPDTFSQIASCFSPLHSAG